MTEKNTQRLEVARDRDRMIMRRDGKEVPAASFQPRDVLIHDWVIERITLTEKLRTEMMCQKQADFDDFNAIQELIKEQFGARITGTRGGGEYETLDGLLKIQVTISDARHVGSAITAAEELVSEIMDDLMKDASGEIRKMVDRAFVRNEKTGRLSTARITGLVNQDINHPKWPLAQQALREALQSGETRRYMRFYRRAALNKPWALIELNYSSLSVGDER